MLPKGAREREVEKKRRANQINSYTGVEDTYTVIKLFGNMFKR